MGSLNLGIDFDAQEAHRRVEKMLCERSLSYFIRASWHIVEPGADYYHNWHIDLICAHLEAIARGEEVDGERYNRLLINIPPGFMKSLMVGVFWPAWMWGPFNKPATRFLCASHSQALAIRDNLRMRRLIMSDWYRERWGDRVKLTDDQSAKTKFENTATGFREAVAAGSITGSRGDVVIIDDPHSVESAASEQMRETTKEWFLEAVPTRLNKPKESAIVVIMQRLHEEDVSGIILDHKGKGLPGWDHIMLPMRFDPARACTTRLGYSDPRSEDGELLFEARFPEDTVDALEETLGNFATAGQHQQSSIPRGGGIIQDKWWRLWDSETYENLEFIVAAVDTAYGEKQENDRSAIVVFGLFSIDSKTAFQYSTRTIDRFGNSIQSARVYAEGAPNIVMMYAWAGRVTFPDLCAKIVSVCRANKVDRLLIEGKAAGKSVVQELRKTVGVDNYGIQEVDPGKTDKWQRLYSVQHLFTEGIVWAPDKQ